MQLVIVNSRSLINFSCRDLADIGETGACRVLELMTCSATGTVILMKTALTSNETKVSSYGFTERCFFLMKSVLSLMKDEVLY